MNFADQLQKQIYSLKRYLLWFLLDILVIIVSLFLAWSARSITTTLDIRPALIFGLLAIGVCCTVNHLCSLYHRIWRYASAGEIVVIVAAVGVSAALLTLVDIFWPCGILFSIPQGWPRYRPVPLSVVWMMGLFAFVGFVSVRYRRRVWTGFQWRWQAIRSSPPAPQLWGAGGRPAPASSSSALARPGNS